MKGKKWLVIVLAVALLASVATGVALAASDTQAAGNPGQVFLDKLAGALGIDRAKLDEALKTAGNQTIDQALQEGKITQEQADKIRARVEKGVPFCFGMGMGPGPMRDGGFMKSVADALGMTPQQIQEALKQGKTVADLVAASGMTTDQLRDKVLADMKAQLDQAVADGKLTQDKADNAYSQMQERLQSGDWIDNLGKFGKRFHGRSQQEAQPQQTQQ